MITKQTNQQIDVFDVNQFFCDNWNAKVTVQNLNKCCAKPCRKASTVKVSHREVLWIT